MKMPISVLRQPNPAPSSSHHWAVGALALLILEVAVIQSHAVVNISADDPAIRYTGRFDAADPKQPSCDWPGCSIQARFTGTSITVKLSGGENQFNVFIDGQEKPKIIIDKSKTDYVAAANLTAGTHTLLLTKRTEGFQGVTSFLGLQLEDGQALAALPPRPAKRIQFIGDSYTVGYGVESNTLTCADRTLFDNNHLAYGPIIARAVDAEYSIQAVSGAGMVHNYGDPVPLSAQPMPYFYDRSLYNREQPKWDESKWVPDLIVVALGTNDFSTAVKPSEQQYTSAYKDLLARLRLLHPAAPILCLTFSSDAFQKTYADSVVARAVKAGDARIHRAHMPPLAQSDLGCDYHPNVAGQQKYADALIPVVRQYLGTTGIAPPLNRRKRAAPPQRSGSIETFSIPLSRGGQSQSVNDADYTAWFDARGRFLDFNGHSGDAAR